MLVGCSSAVKSPEMSAAPSEPPTPTFHGMWTTTSPAWRDDEIIGMATTMLTFTRNRYIQYTLEQEPDGTYINDWAESGTWNATNIEIIRTWVGWDDENGTWQTETTSMVKEYFWAEGGDVIFMEPWSDVQESDMFARYTKADISDPYPFTGSWKRVWTSRTTKYVVD